MSEIISPALHLEQIRNIIREKAWYGMDPATGAFDWKTSIVKLAQAVGLVPEIVQSTIENAYTPDFYHRFN